MNEAAAGRLAHGLGLPAPVARVLSGRGMTEIADAARFLAPSLDTASNPFLLPMMDAAVRRLWQALACRESIVVYGDSDVDGLTSTALLTRTLTTLGAARVTPCISARESEQDAFDLDTLGRCILEQRADLVLTVDCGTRAIYGMAVTRAAGVDLIVVDHHEPSEALPEAYAIVNPKLGPRTALHDLAGVGVTLKLCQAAIEHGIGHGLCREGEPDPWDHLEWVALGSVADNVPMTGENRTLVRHGLERLNRAPPPGLGALMETIGIERPLTETNLLRALAPRLNAGACFGRSMTALEVLLTGDPNDARALALELESLNQRRQALEFRMTEEADRLASAQGHRAPSSCVVVGGDGWHGSLLGNVAARLARRYLCPVAVVGFNVNGLGRGSCRGVNGHDLIQGLEACRGLLRTFGGHAMAAGFEIERRQFESFRARFIEAMNAGPSGAPARPIHAWVDLCEVDGQLVDAVERLRPFGEGNPDPVFGARRVRVTGVPRPFGRNHLKLKVASPRVELPAVAFEMAAQRVPRGEVDIAFRVQRCPWACRGNPQLVLQDIRSLQENGG